MTSRDYFRWENVRKCSFSFVCDMALAKYTRTAAAVSAAEDQRCATKLKFNSTLATLRARGASYDQLPREWGSRDTRLYQEKLRRLDKVNDAYREFSTAAAENTAAWNNLSQALQMKQADLAAAGGKDPPPDINQEKRKWRTSHIAMTPIALRHQASQPAKVNDSLPPVAPHATISCPRLGVITSGHPYRTTAHETKSTHVHQRTPSQTDSRNDDHLIFSLQYDLDIGNEYPRKTYDCSDVKSVATSTAAASMNDIWHPGQVIIAAVASRICARGPNTSSKTKITVSEDGKRHVFLAQQMKYARFSRLTAPTFWKPTLSVFGRSCSEWPLMCGVGILQQRMQQCQQELRGATGTTRRACCARYVVDHDAGFAERHIDRYNLCARALAAWRSVDQHRRQGCPHRRGACRLTGSGPCGKRSQLLCRVYVALDRARDLRDGVQRADFVVRISQLCITMNADPADAGTPYRSPTDQDTRNTKGHIIRPALLLKEDRTI
ncbi:hypothetical protein FI667_g5203, partial [Globisporangium splendens]